MNHVNSRSSNIEGERVPMCSVSCESGGPQEGKEETVSYCDGV